jgi:hypothetical protein
MVVPGMPVLSAVAMAGGATVAATAAWEYTPFEVQRIQAACTLAPDIYTGELPKIFVRMLEEGRTKLRTQAVMRELLVPDEDDTFNAIHILVTEEIPKDFKNLDFGFNGDTSYLMCHCGISPFMVIPVSIGTSKSMMPSSGPVCPGRWEPDARQSDRARDHTGRNPPKLP